MHISLTTKFASLLGAVALTGTGLLCAGTARAEDGRTFDCQLLRIYADNSLEGYVCGEPTTYDGPGKVRYLHGTGGYTCRSITARPNTEDGTTTNLKATGCTSGNYNGHTDPPTTPATAVRPPADVTTDAPATER
jgi:hypothetical protein